MFEEWVSTEMMVLKVIDDDKAAANTFFKETALETWIPTEIDNAPAFDYEGRVPQAAIIICWAGDEYSFCLVVDGEEKARSNDREELKKAAEQLGAELQETHTP